MAILSTRGVVAALLALMVAGVCIRLGFWQLDRLEQRRARNAALREALARPPLVLKGDSLAAVMRDPERFRYRRVRVAGEYDGARAVLLRGRASQGRPGVHLVAPLRVDAGDTAILVERGWVPAADASTADPRDFSAPGGQRVEGILQLFPREGPGAVPLTDTVSGAPVTSYQRLELETLRAAIPYPILPVYLQQLPGTEPPGSAPFPVPLPALDEGPHLGYAVQWFGFAAIAVLGLVVVVVRSSPRR